MDERQGRDARFEQRPQENNQCCLTRSEVYALVREIINKKKHDGEVENVCAHVFDSGFADQLTYIRANIDKALITVGGEHTHCKRVSAHVQKIEKIFNLNTSLEVEYQAAASKYDNDKQHPRRNVQ
ncbi:LEF-11 [Agrotis segetum nucleopolyhedrovirus A]|uniref:Late expression factor 11 n=1 Tax=Agrotis segetum nuclear polyhedrosis virus TaxID=1962501 RepID=Q287E1_NPVAS|nr:LEF-11 [Agrotis segetum nucleopolyhedrovirus A]AAZ38297.1 LEF-11 [Agrotis segetum nucleopolyhedrovirus A]